MDKGGTLPGKRFATHSRHHEVGDDGVVVDGVEKAESFHAVGYMVKGAILECQNFAQQISKGMVVLREKHAAHELFRSFGFGHGVYEWALGVGLISSIFQLQATCGCTLDADRDKFVKSSEPEPD